jgi:hypothetical protein
MVSFPKDGIAQSTQYCSNVEISNATKSGLTMSSSAMGSAEATSSHRREAFGPAFKLPKLRLFETTELFPHPARTSHFIDPVVKVSFRGPGPTHRRVPGFAVDVTLAKKSLPWWEISCPYWTHQFIFQCNDFSCMN